MKIRRYKVVENLKFKFLKGFLGIGSKMRAGIVAQQKNTL
jgi:hypothetical protein